MDLKEVEVLGDQVADHWYYVAKSAAMLRFLNGIPVRRILDVGAGSGFFARHLLSSSVEPYASYPCGQRVARVVVSRRDASPGSQ
jgi:hypothetical protein